MPKKKPAPAIIHFSTIDQRQPTIDCPSADRSLGIPPQRTTWEAYSGEKEALSIGEWECEPGAWRITFHAHRHEFFHVLSGRLRLIDTAGLATDFGPGEAGVIPAGFTGVFEVVEAVRKRYVMFDKPGKR